MLLSRELLSTTLPIQKTKEEYEALNKHALILIVAISQEASELPIKRVYIRQGNSDFELTRFLRPRMSQTPKDSLTRSVLGEFREDSYFPIPIDAIYKPGRLLVDFAENRTEFVLDEFPFEPKEKFIRSDKNRTPKSGETIAPFRLLQLMSREFLGITIEPGKPQGKQN